MVNIRENLFKKKLHRGDSLTLRSYPSLVHVYPDKNYNTITSRISFSVKTDTAGSGGDSSGDEDSDDDDDRVTAEEKHDEVRQHVITECSSHILGDEYLTNGIYTHEERASRPECTVNDKY